jgi:hypothetical protein
MKANLMNKEVDLEADTINVSLMTTNHAFTATHNLWSEVSANELPAAGGYTAGGAALSGKVVTQAATTKWDATDLAWTSATFTAYHAVIHDLTAQSAANILVGSIDFGAAKTVTAGTFTIQWDAAGIITLA